MRQGLRRVWQWYRADETVLVTRPRRAWRWLTLHAVCMLTASIAALVVARSNSWYAVIGMGYLGGLIGSTALGRHRRARAYWSGWLRGRAAMVSSLAEAGRRDMDMHDWLSAEMTRDLTMIGAEGNEEEDDPRG